MKFFFIINGRKDKSIIVQEVGKQLRMLAPSFEEQETSTEILETGIKVIDLISPFTKGGKIGRICGYDSMKKSTLLISSEQRRYEGDTIVEDGTLRQIVLRYVIRGDELNAVVDFIKKIQENVKIYDENGFLSALAFSDRDDMEISVFGNDDRIMITSRFDNLGKGASGAAIQCMNILLGADEAKGLNL